MTISLIQGTLLAAYCLQHTHKVSQEEKGARGCLSALPPFYRMATCLAVTWTLLSFIRRCKFSTLALPILVIKEAFECHYDCLGVTWEEIGGLYDADTGKYLECAEPCKGQHQQHIYVDWLLKKFHYLQYLNLWYSHCQSKPMDSRGLAKPSRYLVECCGSSVPIVGGALFQQQSFV